MGGSDEEVEGRLKNPYTTYVGNCGACKLYKTLSPCSYETAFLSQGKRKIRISLRSVCVLKRLVFLFPSPSLLWAPKTSPQPSPPPFYFCSIGQTEKKIGGGGRIVYHVRLNGKASVT